MAYCHEGREGKEEERAHSVTYNNHETPSGVQLVADNPKDQHEEHELVLPNGDVNWNCLCLGGMVSGPSRQKCLQKCPNLYRQKEEAKKPTEHLEESAPIEAPATKEEDRSS
ncbi:unnamed protein product [Nyctereutes procyonoides]|uniref:(raccoon dog) hypothetical protein n=1 Tax=Nyctereutes procyonoides TaxID=34880 RepID=A0A811YWB1_NYCPR|nr:unnamed protein product [Nyctereutes procyonoides]